MKNRLLVLIMAFMMTGISGLYAQDSFTPSVNWGGRIKAFYSADLTDMKAVKHGFTLADARLSVFGSALPYLDFFAQLKMGSDKGVTLSAVEFSMPFMPEFTPTVGYTWDGIERESGGGSQLFVSDPYGYIYQKYDGDLIGAVIHSSLLDDTLQIRVAFGDSGLGSNIKSLGSKISETKPYRDTYGAAFRIQYDPFGAWNQGSEWLQKDKMKLSFGLGVAYDQVGGTIQEAKAASVKDGTPAKTGIDMVNSIAFVADMGFTIDLFYMQGQFGLAAHQLTDTLETLEDDVKKMSLRSLGGHIDFGFTATEWMVPAIRLFGTLGNSEFVGKFADDKAKTLGVAVVANFYPFEASHTFKVQTEFKYTIINKQSDGEDGSKDMTLKVAGVLNF